jgi:pyridinium-3,5-biscarboxylic acid mononucleotide sulfurtransferase
MLDVRSHLPNADVPAAAPSDAAVAKERALLAWLARQESVLIGYSGGVDSAYLAACALEALGPSRVLAVIGRSASLPVEQWRGARSTADAIGIPVEELDTAELADPRYASNPSNRCYFCKAELWGRLVPVARARGFAVVADGTNASDLGGHRPGMAAAREQGVASPLAEAGLSKDEIRVLSRARGLPTWSQPSAPCLASRIPYGTEVTPARLREVELAEDALRALGVAGDLRVRHHGALARVELSPDELERHLSVDALARLTTAVRGAGFARAAVDLRGFRSGGLLKLGKREAGCAERAVETVSVDGADEERDRAATAGALCRALARRGIEAQVRTEGVVTLLSTRTPARFAEPQIRQATLAIAEGLGFRTLSLTPRDDS